jgi:PucR C-terminal helix-turn-helix domain/GGDEF-like domain
VRGGERVAKTTVSTKDVLEWLDRRAHELDESDLRAILGALAPVVADVPEVVADEDLVAEANVAAREMMRLLIGSALPAIGRRSGEAAPAAVVSVVRVWAQRGIDLSVLMRGYRRAHTEFWRYWMADVAGRIEDPGLRMAVLEHSWERVSAWHESQLEQLETIYAEQRDRWLSGAQARRAEAVRLLLAGEAVDSEQAAVMLGYDLRSMHTALVLWAQRDEPEADALAGLEDAVRELAHALGSKRTLTLSAGSRAVWAWIATDAEAADGPSRDMTSAALPAAVRVAAGRAAAGVEGFRSSHQDAQLVRRLMPIAGQPAQLVRFDDVELTCLMSSEPEAMRRLVAHALGDLARRDPSAARLRETARVYLACGANAREAAERLNMHKNTVHYRLARIEEQLGRPVTERRLELEIALMLAHTLGDRVLPQPR